MSCLFQHEY
jgi:hypothetical protein